MSLGSDSNEAAVLLEDLRQDSQVNDDALFRVRERIASSLQAPRLHADAPRAAVGSGSAHGRRAPWAVASRGGLLVALAVGSALGAGGHALVSAVVSSATYSAPSAPRKLPSTPAAPVKGIAPAAAARAADPEAAPASQVQQRAKSLPAPSAVASHSAVEAQLDRELRELDQARGAIAAGKPSQALSMLSSHSQRYPTSILQQEREALTIKALVAAGRHAEARAAGARFAENYPNSMLLDSVKNALGTIP